MKKTAVINRRFTEKYEYDIAPAGRLRFNRPSLERKTRPLMDELINIIDKRKEHLETI